MAVLMVMAGTLDGPAAPSRASRSALGVFAAYLLLAVVATYPVAFQARDHVFGEGTPPLNVWALGWVLHQLPRDPLHLFDANAFYPYEKTLAFSEHLFVPALMAAPVVLLTGNLVLAHNVVALLTLATAGLGMYLLAKELTGDGASSFAAGVLYAFHTWNINELIRLQILSNQWFPLLLLSLLRFFARPSSGRAAAVGLFYLLESLSCMYWALYLPMLVAPALLILILRHRTAWRALVPLALCLGAALLITGLFLIPYVQTTRELGLRRDLPDSLGLDRYFDVLKGNLLYRALPGTAQPNQNAAHFLGFVSMGLGLLGLVRGNWKAERAFVRPLLLVLAVAAFALSLGPEIRWGVKVLAPGPYGFLIENVPGFRNVRYPERFSIFVVLSVAPMLAAGLSRLRPRVGMAGVALASGLVFLEHLSVPLQLVPLPPGEAIPSVHRWLAGEAGVRVVAEVPASRFRLERFDALPMYLSTAHWKRTVQAFSGYFPPTYNFIKWRLVHFPEPESVAFLQKFGVDTVVVNPGADGLPSWAGPDPRWDVKGPFPEGHVALRLKDAELQRFAPPPQDEAPMAELDRRGWAVRASRADPRLAVDGDPKTAWSTRPKQTHGEFYSIRFPRAVPVARISMSLRSPYCFPLHLKVTGEVGRSWVELPFDEASAYDRLFASLLYCPRDVRFTIDLEPRPVTALRLRITKTDPYGMPWIMSEAHLYQRK